MHSSTVFVLLRQLTTAVLFLVLLLLEPRQALALEKATLQLKWLHHFQFAGYYMALEKGFYRDAGLDVTIREGGPAAEVENDVVSGRADFGVGTSALLLNLAQGQDVVVLGQIFQHSPAIFLTPRETGIRSIMDMRGRRFMYSNQHGDMRALLKRHGLDEDRIVKVPHHGDPHDLINGKADVMLAYSFNEPYVMEQAGIPYLTFSPLAFGIDFYGDNFFTTRRLLKARPEFVRAFREATLKGWRYALEHREEAVDLIHARYVPRMDRELLLFEAEQMDPLIQPVLVELGYQNLARWHRISETFAELGMLPAGFDPSPIMYAPRQISDYGPLFAVLTGSGAIIAILTWLAVGYRRMGVMLKSEVDERKRTETELRETQELFSLFMKHTPVYTFIKEIEGGQSRVILVSENFIDMIGRPAGEMLGRTMAELFPAEFARKITDDDLAVVREGKVVQLDEEFNGRSYTTIKFPITRGDGKSLIAGFTIDISERKRAEAALRKSEEDFRLLAEAMPQIVWITRPDGWNIYFNQQWVTYTGMTLEESYGHGWNIPFHPDDRQRAWDSWQNTVTNGTPYSLECRLRRSDGVYKWWLVRGVPVLDDQGTVLKWFGTCTDIDEFKKAEEERLAFEQQLRHAQKLESLGVLAGGIAHDFNNILMAIIGNADLALMKLNPESPVITHLHQIEKAASRAADLAKQMLAYSGKGIFLIENLDLNRMLEEMQHMLEVSISRKVVLQMNLAPRIPTLEADASQIRQTIMNLVINASEAMGDNSGVITITTGCREYDRSSLKGVWLNEDLAEGLYTFLEVADTGCGMDSDTLSRLFDPFFTTKFTGRGLGMAAVLGIVRGHKGGIQVSSTPGEGTTFRVLLPASGRPVAVVENQPAGGDWQGRGTVLLVDDEESVREIGGEMLQELGFSVVAAGDGKEAVDLFAARDDFALVILDLTMPRMDGEQCLRELQRIRGDVTAIISSGYNERDVMRRFTGHGVAGFIQKPYRLEALRQVLKGVAPA